MSSENSPQQRKPAHLCAICRTIPFDGLVLPFQHETEIQSASENVGPVSGFYDMDKNRTDTKIKFGLMSRVLNNEESCDFCAMVGSLLRRHPTSPFGPRNKVIIDEVGRPYYENLSRNADRPCEVKLMWFVGIKHPVSPSRSRWSARLFVNWKDDRGAYQGAYSCFQTLHQGVGMAFGKPPQSDPFSHDLFCGGRYRPLTLDLNWVRHWISLCVDGHTDGCSKAVDAPVQHGTKVRLVNVKTLSLDVDIDLTAANHDLRYLALSYVWGDDDAKHEYKLVSKNLSRWQQPGSLDIDRLPATLADLITLAQLLEIPYVWVDAICIVQDDREDKIVQIAAMNAIYQHAFITVIAAGGDNADAGLPGLHSRTRFKHPKEITIRLSDLNRDNKNSECDYITLIETLNHPEHTNWTPLTSTTWNSRAWTYQERLLSKRVLIFTEEQVYWSCSEANFCEEVCMEFPQHSIVHHPGAVDPIEASFHTIFRDSTLDPQQSQTKAQSQVWKAYKNFVTQYSRRHMRYNGDYHAAFSGILDALSSLAKDEFLLGHPRSRFEHGLSWTNFRSIKRRTDLSGLPMTARDVRIMIPSWSWMGWVGEVVFNVTQDKEADGALPQVECFVHRTLPLRLVPARTSSNLHDQEELNGSEDWVYISHEGLTLEDITQHHPQLTSQHLDNIPDETVLFFWASTSRFHVEYPDMSDFDLKMLANTGQVPVPKILDDDGHVVGELQQLETIPVHDGGKAEFVVVERKSEPDPEMATLLGDEVYLTVLQIGWRIDAAGSGRCKERLNIGTIKEKNWLKSQPQRSLVALQ